MAKAVGGYLEKPADFMDAEKGVQFFDRDRNIAFFGNSEKSGIGELINYAADIWGKAGKLKMKNDYSTLVDPSFVKAQ